MVKEQYEAIRNWAKSRGIYETGDIKTQCLKLDEEQGEIAQAMALKDNDLLKDGIGDCMVVVTNVCYFLGFKIEDVLYGSTTTQKDIYVQYAHLTLAKAKISECIIKSKGEQVRLHINNYICELRAICRQANVDLSECVEIAYREISARKGKMIDGNFVKQEDLS